MRYQKILIATDFSDASAVAVRRGVDLAQQFGAEIHLFHCVPISQISVLAPVESAHLADDLLQIGIDQAKKQMAELEKETDFGHCKVRTEVREADFAATGVLAYVEEHDIDVIVLGTHGRRGLRRMLMGSVAEEIVRTAPCAVFTCTPEVDAIPVKPEELLVAVDFSETSREALRVARDLGDLYRCRVRAVHVVPRPHYAPEYSAAGAMILENMPEVLEAARKSLQRELDAVGTFDNGVELEAVVGSAAHEILKCAKKHDVNLIVMGNRGLSGLKHVLLGSVADRVVRRAGCPVLTVHVDADEEPGDA